MTEPKTRPKQLQASKEYDKDKEGLRIRVPKGSVAVIKAYVERKAQEEPDNPKYNSYNGKGYRPSVNAMITNLLEEEMKVKFADIAEKKKKKEGQKDD